MSRILGLVGSLLSGLRVIATGFGQVGGQGDVQAPGATAQGAMAHLCEPEEIERARQIPPATRAALRGAFVVACLEVGADFSVSWESLRLDSPPTAPVDLPDPLETVHDAAESLTQRVRCLRPEEMHRIDLVGRGGLGAPG